MRPISQVVAHVDGSCRNGGKSHASAGLGAIIKLNNVRFAQIAVPLKGPERPTSTVAELSAALFALEFGAELCERLRALGFSVPFIFSILSDCEHVTKVFSGQRNSYKFRRLWSGINNARQRLHDSGVVVRAIAEPAHAGYPGNEEADRLAKRASRRIFRRRRRVPHTVIKCLLGNCSGSHHIENAEELAAHVCAKHVHELEAAPFECAICKHSFDSHVLLTKHYESDHSVVSVSEDDDGSGTTTSSSDYDESSNEEYVDVECVFCQRVYYADDILRHLHADHFHDEDEYICSECGDMFVGRHFLAQHVQDVHDDELSVSELTWNSDRSFSDQNSGEDISGDGNSRIENSDDDNSNYETSSDYSTTDDDSDHVANSDSDDGSDGFPTFSLYECCFCDRYYGSINGLTRHWDFVHEVEVDDEVVQCEECHMHFPGKDSLETHRRMWHGMEP